MNKGSNLTVNNYSESKSRANKTLLGGILIIAMELGTYVTLSNYVSSLCDKLGAGTTQVVFMFSIASITMLICNLISVLIIDRVPTRLLTFVGTLGFILFFVCLRFCHSIGVLYLGAIGLGIASVFASFTVLQPMITWWHLENTGKKMGYMSMAYALAGIIFGTLIAKFIDSIGFEKTVTIHGIIACGIMLFASVYLISDKPERYGLLPYGAATLAGGNTGAATPAGGNNGTAVPVEQGLSFSESLRTLPLWGIILGLVLGNIIFMGYSNNSSMIYQSYGLDLVSAGLMISVYNVVAIAWNYIYGASCDRRTPGKTNLFFSVLGAAILLISSMLTGMPGAVFVAVLYGFVNFFGMVAAVSLPKIYGTKSVGPLIVMCLVASSLGTALGGPLGSYIYEATGSYAGFQRLGALIMVIVAVLFWFSTGKKGINHVKKIAESTEKFDDPISKLNEGL